MEHERDIDKDAELLVELLYGERDVEDTELSDESRAELESLGELRALFRAMPDEEPPNAVSAKLLAAAAQHAPNQAAAVDGESHGFFGWLAGLFKPIMMHPGLAAAASLVTVAGVAGTLYVTGRDDVAQPSSGASFERNESTRGAEMAPAEEPDMPAKAAEDTASLSADSDDSAGDTSEFGAAGAAAPPPPVDEKPARAGTTSSLSNEEQKQVRTPAPKGKIRATRIEGVVGGSVIPEPEQNNAPSQIKDTRRRDRDKKENRVDRELGDGAGDDFAGGEEAPQAPAPEPSPAKDRPADRSKLRKAPAKPKPTDTKSDDNKKQDKDSASRRKAKKLHGSAAAAAAQGNCKKALSLGTQIRKTDSRYYDDVFLSDARIRKCRDAAKSTSTRK